MTLEQLEKANRYSHQLYKLKETIGDLSTGLGKKDLGYLRANVHTDAQFLNEIELEFYAKVRDAMRAEYERIKQKFDEL